LRLFVLGGTGKTGREIVDLGLARGHTLTLLVRSPEKVSRRDGPLTVIPGDPHSVEAQAVAMRDHDAVLSALGPPIRKMITGTTLLRETSACTIDAMGRAGVKRLVIISSAMACAAKHPMFLPPRLIMRPHYRDLVAMEALVSQSALEWTLARPHRLGGRSEESFVASTDDPPLRGGVLPFRAMAAFMLDAAEHRKYVRERVGVSP
jgi:putative NADH-flavin reductase